MQTAFCNMPRWQMAGLVPRTVFLGVAVVVLATACNKGSPDGPGSNCVNGVSPFTDTPAPKNGIAQFTVVPVAPAPGLSLTALGNLNPPGHVLPTDHVYFYATDLSKPAPSPVTATRNVYMPATGAMNVGDVYPAGTLIGTTDPGGTFVR